MLSLDRRVANFLKLLGRKRHTITYSDLLQRFGYPPVTEEYRWHITPMHPIFRALDVEDKGHHRPLRTSVVVLKSEVKTKKSVPGDGYFKSLCGYRNKPLPKGIQEKRVLHEAECEALAEYYIRGVKR